MTIQIDEIPYVFSRFNLVAVDKFIVSGRLLLFLSVTFVYMAMCGCGQNQTVTQISESRALTLRNREAESSSAKPEGSNCSIRFRDITPLTGINFSYRNGEEAQKFSILESLGGGVGFLDYDCDGSVDLYIPGGGDLTSTEQVIGRSGAIFRQSTPGKFQECSGLAGVSQAKMYSHGVAIADYDNDGFSDILVTGYGGLQFFCNQGDGTFQERSHEAGLNDDQWSSSAGWGDLDGDGDLDLYVVHYVDWSFENHPLCPGPGEHAREICSPKSFQGLTDSVYRNEGNGKFENISESAGITREGKGLGVLLADLDLDNSLDIYVANDTVPNFLYRLEQESEIHVRDVSLSSGTAVSDRGLPTGSMGIGLGDFNLDGYPDLWVANYEQEGFALYSNRQKGLFQHVSRMVGVANIGADYVGWGTLFGDFDQDGDEDIFGSNGHVIRYPDTNQIAQLPILLENLSGKSFANIAPEVGEYFRNLHHGRGVAAGDFDNDGDLDLAISRNNQPIVLLSNETLDPGHWLQISLTGTKSNRTGIGAVVRVQTKTKTLIRQLAGGNSYASTHDPRLHFGLGADAQIEKLEVCWPSGTIQQLEHIQADQQLNVIEDSELFSSAAPAITNLFDR